MPDTAAAVSPHAPDVPCVEPVVNTCTCRVTAAGGVHNAVCGDAAPRESNTSETSREPDATEPTDGVVCVVDDAPVFDAAAVGDPNGLV